MRAKFCLECGAAMALDLVDQLPQQASGGERRLVTVLFADLSGFTSFSEAVDVEEVRAIARETADRLGEIVEHYGGTVDKVIGDCVMAVWGAPTSHEDDAERAVRAAIDMQAHFAENADRFANLPLSIGLTTGEAIWAQVGGQHTVLGDTVNTAARLQGAAAHGEILVGEPTYTSTAESIVYEVLEPIVAKNKRDPVPAFKALSVTGVVQRRRASRMPMVGRSAELQRIWEQWERARTERHPYSVMVLGAAGVGKSRLIQAITHDIGDSALVLHSTCLPYGEGITYWPVTEMIKQAAGIQHGDDHEDVSRKLGDLLEGLGSDDLDELRTMAVALANLVGEPTTPRGSYAATEISRGELHWGVRRIIELASTSRPLVLVIDDLHYAEPALLELLEFVLEPRADAALLGLSTARPEFTEVPGTILDERPNLRVLTVEMLDDAASLEIIRQLAGEGDIPETTVRRIVEASGGNPLFLEEMVQTWIDARATGEAIEELDVPGSLQSLIDSRLDRLPADEREVLGRAAVVGDVFWSGALAALQGRSNGAVDGVLAALEERDLIRASSTTNLTGEREYAFKNGLIREVAYGRIPKSERAALHERCGEWIGALGEEEFAEIIAYHLEESCKLAAQVGRSAHAPPTLAAVTALTRAAEKSEGREGTREAARYYDRALELLDGRYPETAIDLKVHRARAKIALGELEAAYADLTDGATAASGVGRADLRCRALVNLAETCITMGRADEAREQIELAKVATQQNDDARHAIRLALVRAVLHGSVDGSVADAERDLREAIELAEEAEEAHHLTVAHIQLGILYYNVGRLTEAEDEFRRVVDLASARGSLRQQGIGTSMLAAVLYHVGPREEAELLAAQAVLWFERLNNRHQQSQALRLQGKLALERDDPAEAQRRFTNALAILPPHRLLVAGMNRLLAEARARQGKAVGARSGADAAAEAATEQEPYAQAFAAVALACAETAEGSVDRSQEAFDRALGLFEQLGMATDLAESRVTFARALSHFGRFSEARDQLGLARSFFEQMDAGASVAHVDELLSRTTEGADVFGPLG